MEPYLGDNLIFIISQPRSGSTMLQRVLSGHSEIQTTAETWMMLHPIYSMRSTGIETEYNANWRRQAMHEFLENYASGAAVYDDAIRAYADVLYGHVLTRNDKRLFLDKTPRYFFIIPELYRLFPRAKFIFLLRNPLAVLQSELTTYVKNDWKVLGWFKPDLVDAPALIQQGIDLLGNAGHVVRYESFVDEPEKHTAELCDYLGIDMQPSMVDYAGTPAPKGGMNDPVGVHRHSRPKSDSSDNWKKLADNPQYLHFAHEYLNAIGQLTLSRLGYDLSGLKQALGPAPDVSRASIYPWTLAMRPWTEWNLGERYRAELYESFQRHPGSALLTSLGATRRWLQFVGRQIRHALDHNVDVY